MHPLATALTGVPFYNAETKFAILMQTIGARIATAKLSKDIVEPDEVFPESEMLAVFDGHKLPIAGLLASMCLEPARLGESAMQRPAACLKRPAAAPVVAVESIVGAVQDEGHKAEKYGPQRGADDGKVLLDDGERGLEEKTLPSRKSEKSEDTDDAEKEVEEVEDAKETQPKKRKCEIQAKKDNIGFPLDTGEVTMKMAPEEPLGFRKEGFRTTARSAPSSQAGLCAAVEY
eukprot:CAMPEP_0177549658 /NCGR_PEP_ID=MMETSP0369-20130122/65152_1 /TAXON_ID=447022 ORGANISM="Scrippsiella hangoei-like, Strain SHHI-4" /NCGR_SAMPLE_ID=MMETSP0369 /ASSEMBLY_ACC=CAM_ASM_000364 /LENGTH=231 /DNA_ID=CAMNT_0019034799 /DNA_START=81 /DNA_END=775 /DNA_ORIENTATION=+